MLEIHPDKRIGAAEALSHPYFARAREISDLEVEELAQAYDPSVEEREWTLQEWQGAGYI
jgi:serine/threonine protein kinase